MQEFSRRILRKEPVSPSGRRLVPGVLRLSWRAPRAPSGRRRAAKVRGVRGATGGPETTGSLLRVRPTARGPPPPPVHRAPTALRGSSRTQHPRLSLGPASPRASASPVCGRLRSSKSEGQVSPSDTFADVAPEPPEAFLVPGSSRGKEGRGLLSAGAPARKPSEETPPTEMWRGRRTGNCWGGEEDRGSRNWLRLRGPTLPPSGTVRRGRPRSGEGIADATYLEFEEFQ